MLKKILFLFFYLGLDPAVAKDLSIQTTGGVYGLYDESHALVIGIEKYDAHPTWQNLSVVPMEVEEISSALKNQGFEVEIPAKPNPTLQELNDLLRNFFSRQYSPNSRLILFFAGHGWSDHQYAGYVVPSDAPVPGDNKFRTKIMSFQTIESYAQNAQAKHVLLVFDSCFAGWAFRSSNNYIPNTESYIRDLDRRTLQIVTSGTSGEKVPDSPHFYKEFIRGISGGANMAFDNIVTLNELGYWLKLQVARKGEQTPQYGSSKNFKNSAGDMVFANLQQNAAPIQQVGNGKIEDLEPPEIAERKLAVLEPEGQIGPRQSTLRSLGESSSDLYSGLEVIYYRKFSDGLSVLDALDSSKIPYLAIGSDKPEGPETNTVACGPDIPAEALRNLLHTLVSGGVPIRRVITFNRPEEKPKRIEVLSSENITAYFWEDESPDTAVLTHSQIEEIKSCSEIRGSRI